MVENSDKNNENRRRSQRIDARIKVEFKTGQEFIACYSENLSKGGIYLQTERAPDPNAIIELALNLPSGVQDSARQILLQGRIVRLMSLSESGKTVHKVAIQFVEMTPQVQTQLDLFYDRLLKTQAKSK